MVHKIPHKARCPECGCISLIDPKHKTALELGLPGGKKLRIVGCPACFVERLNKLVGPLPELEDLGPDPEGGTRIVPC